MKNAELFDILGNIDDKFYDEALGGDSERPMEILIKKPAFSIKNVLMPAAACLAVAAGIGVTAHFLNKADLINPNPADSNTLPNVALANPNITPEDFEQCKELVQKYLTDPNGEFDFEHNTQIIDIDFDNCDEIVMTPDFYTIVVFDKTVDGMVETAKLDAAASINGACDICEYESGGKRYFYLRSYSFDPNGVVATAAARINYDNGEYSIDYPLAYGYYYQSDPKEYFFMADCGNLSEFTKDPVSNIEPAEFKARWTEHEGLPKFDYYLSFDEEYPLLSEVEIPVVESAFLSADNMLHGATLYAEDLGEYKLCLLAKTVFRRAGSDDPDHFCAGSLILGLVKDDTLVSSDGVSFSSAVHDGFANYYLDPQKLDSYFKLYKLRDCNILVFGMLNNEKLGWESNFFGIKDGVITKLFGLDGNGWFVNAPFDLTVDGKSLIDTKKAVKYEFYPDAFEGNPYENPHFTKTEYIPNGGYPKYNGTAAPQATLCEKALANGDTVKLLAINAEPVTNGGVQRVEYSKAFLRREKSDGTIVWTVPIGINGGIHGLIASRLDDYLVTIRFNGGEELIAVYQSLDEGAAVREYAVFYGIGDGKGFLQKPSERHGACIPSGDPTYLGTDFTLSANDWTIILGGIAEGEKIVFDFDNNMFDTVEPER